MSDIFKAPKGAAPCGMLALVPSPLYSALAEVRRWTMCSPKLAALWVGGRMGRQKHGDGNEWGRVGVGRRR